ncbi:unnamed protein product [Chrysoparadoxa australica]
MQLEKIVFISAVASSSAFTPSILASIHAQPTPHARELHLCSGPGFGGNMAGRKEMPGDGAAEQEAGRCQMCKRSMPLTKHHVIPKSTHKRFRKKPHRTWPEGIHLDATVDICRPCHSAIHRTHDELTLARDFWLVE